jgi:hypothetical protein
MDYRQYVKTRPQSTLTVPCCLRIHSVVTSAFGGRRYSAPTASRGQANSASVEACSSRCSRPEGLLQLGCSPCHDDRLRSARVASASGASCACRTGCACRTSCARCTSSACRTGCACRTRRAASARPTTGARCTSSAARARATRSASGTCSARATSSTTGTTRVAVVRAIVTARSGSGDTQNADQYQTPMIKTDTCHSGVIYTDRSQCKIFLSGRGRAHGVVDPRAT